ncbi:MAG: hypothetical protein JST50_11585 [Bacteroidetes bacterium]|jgi:hypothetical protein|nr:hypothetical protein [Bacteroidota bacterium]
MHPMVMNMRIIFLIFLIITGFQISGVSQTKASQDDEQILEVEYFSSGSEMGGYFDLKISKSSIKCYGQKKKTDRLFWDRLIASINLTDFDNAPHAKATSSIDGIDNIIRIKTTKRVHSIVLTSNPNDYANMKTFIDLLSDKLKEY